MKQINNIWLELVLALKSYDQNFWSGYKTWITLTVLAATIYVLPEVKLSAYVELAGMAHLFALTIAKKVTPNV